MKKNLSPQSSTGQSSETSETQTISPFLAWRVFIALLLPQLAFGLSYTWISLAPHLTS
jgi:hypothetical protein